MSFRFIERSDCSHFSPTAVKAESSDDLLGSIFSRMDKAEGSTKMRWASQCADYSFALLSVL